MQPLYTLVFCNYSANWEKGLQNTVAHLPHLQLHPSPSHLEASNQTTGPRSASSGAGIFLLLKLSTGSLGQEK